MKTPDDEMITKIYNSILYGKKTQGLQYADRLDVAQNAFVEWVKKGKPAKFNVKYQILIFLRKKEKQNGREKNNANFIK